jgi:hypothetical protein
MSMQWVLTMVSSERANELEADEEALSELICSIEMSAGFHLQGEATHLSWTWNGIDHLLSRIAGDESAPLRKAVTGGREFGVSDQGYGPALYQDASMVREIAAALEATSSDVLRSHFDPVAMDEQGVYPSGIWQREGQSALDSLIESYAVLVEFYQAARKSGAGVIQAII